MSNLTPKQEKFVQGVISGLSQREAYKQSFNSSKMKDTTIDVKASQLFALDKVRVRYQELLEEHKNKALWTREEAVNDLIWLKQQAKNDIEITGVKQANTNAFVNAIKELNSLEDLSLANKRAETSIIKANKEIEFIEERIKLLKGSSKDTSLLETLINAVKNDG